MTSIHTVYPQQGCEVITPRPMVGTSSVQVICGNCHRSVKTKITKTNGACTCIATLFVLLLCWPCFWVPLCMDACKDVHHSCPECGARLGSFKKI